MRGFGQLRVMCLGDVMLDRFHYGRADRLSPEAPVPVVHLRESRVMLGGAGNVARNIASLGGEAILVGVVGEDDAGREIARLIDGITGVTDANTRTSSRPTISKTRIFAAQQQVVRLDEEVLFGVDEQVIAETCTRIDEWLPGCHALIVSDYAKGLLGQQVLSHAIGAARAFGLPVVVDPKREDCRAYRGATVLKPNLRELAAATHMPVGTEEQILAAATRLMQEAEVHAVLVTRSDRGMMLVEENGTVHSVPAQVREVFDVSGAGDTVGAVLALSLAAGYSLKQATGIANAAAGVVVNKRGTAVLEMEELIAAIEDEAAKGVALPDKVASLDQALANIESWRRRGLTIGFANGCFDILHRGHVTMLQAARARCDRLIVALNADASVRRLKGPTRPVNPLEDRSAVMAALQAVDLVVSFEEDTPLELVTRLQPDVLFKGSDYRAEDVVGGDVVRARGGHVALIDLVPGRSTTGILARGRELA